MFQVIR